MGTPAMTFLMIFSTGLACILARSYYLNWKTAESYARQLKVRVEGLEEIEDKLTRSLQVCHRDLSETTGQRDALRQSLFEIHKSAAAWEDSHEG